MQLSKKIHKKKISKFTERFFSDIFVFNNNGYSSIKSTQSEFLNKQFYGSTPDTGLHLLDIKKIAKAFNKKALLLPFPVSWMVLVAKLLGKEADAVRLFSSLVVDSNKARNLLDWRPVTTMNDRLCKIADNEKNI